MKKQSLRKLILTAIFAAVIAVIAPITIPTGVVPFTLSLFAIFLCGSILPPLSAVLATLVYITLGTVGLPVFSMYSGGFSKLIGPTGGFIWAYPFMVLVIALSVRLLKKRNILSLSVGMAVSMIICYTFGTLWYCHLTGAAIIAGLTICVLPYIVFDIIKAAVAIVIAMALNRFSIINNEVN